MALSEDQQRHVLARVREIIIDDFHNDFEGIYSYAVTVLQLAPEQANNEIRNALNHLARALIAEEDGSAKDNLLQAKGHIERAKRDCVKLAVIHLHEQITSHLMNVELIEGAVPMSVKTRHRSIISAGVDARKAEAAGAADILDRYSSVLADLQEFEDDIRMKFTVPSRPLTWWRRILIHFRLALSSFVVGVLVALAAHWLYDHFDQLWPPPKPTATSSPSAGAKPAPVLPPKPH
jgi:hypothetical protein